MCCIYRRPMTAFAGTGGPHAYPDATQLLPAHESASYAVDLQHGSSFPCTASAASKQPAMWHNISSASSPSYTSWAMLHNIKGLFSGQPFTSSAAQGPGTGSVLLPTQPHALAQEAESHRRVHSTEQHCMITLGALQR